MHPLAAHLLGGLAAIVAVLPAMAQDTLVRSAVAPTGRLTRIAVVPNLKSDCKPGEQGSIRVVTAPRNGTLIVRSGKVTTPSTYRCPNVEATIQALFYRPNDRYLGADEIVIETKLPDGKPQSVTVRIRVTDQPRSRDRNLIDL